MSVAFDILVLLYVFEHTIGHSLIPLSHLIKSIIVAILDGVRHELLVWTYVVECIFQYQITISKKTKKIRVKIHQSFEEVTINLKI